jgi:hypothetical protein
MITLLLARNLEPGGFFEIKDIKFPIEDNDNSFPEDCAIRRWTELIHEGTVKLGRPTDSAKHYKQWLIDAGFVNVVEMKFKWPQNKWPKDKRLKELGMWMHENFSEGLSGMSELSSHRALNTFIPFKGKFRDHCLERSICIC